MEQEQGIDMQGSPAAGEHSAEKSSGRRTQRREVQQPHIDALGSPGAGSRCVEKSRSRLRCVEKSRSRA